MIRQKGRTPNVSFHHHYGSKGTRKLISLGTLAAGQVGSDAAHSCNTLLFSVTALYTHNSKSDHHTIKTAAESGKRWVHLWKLQKNYSVLGSNWPTTPLLGVLEVWSKPTLSCCTLSSALKANCVLIFLAVPSWMYCWTRDMAQAVECLPSRREAQGSVCSLSPLKPCVVLHACNCSP